jgi:hypothetical protein
MEQARFGVVGAAQVEWAASRREQLFLASVCVEDREQHQRHELTALCNATTLRCVGMSLPELVDEAVGQALCEWLRTQVDVGPWASTARGLRRAKRVV